MSSVDHPFRIGFDGGFSAARASTVPEKAALSGKETARRLEAALERIDELQRRLYADRRFAVLLIFQAMDAAGKDGTIRAVFRGVDPAGCFVHAFKQPTLEEQEHDFLWRTSLRLPKKGHIAIFNRSYYEEVLAVRVHPEWLAAQRVDGVPPARPEGRARPGGAKSILGRPGDRLETSDLDALWASRFHAIREHERHLRASGTVILKFWLNISRDEQRRRFLSRLDEPEKHWKFSEADVRERGHWDDYMRAYEAALGATSRAWAPWYAIPADDKPYMRMSVAETLARALQDLDLAYPPSPEMDAARIEALRKQLKAD
jgi:PPK2 family polyphosphate:nucleotide phosphotransferase